MQTSKWVGSGSVINQRVTSEKMSKKRMNLQTDDSFDLPEHVDFCLFFASPLLDRKVQSSARLASMFIPNTLPYAKTFLDVTILSLSPQ